MFRRLRRRLDQMQAEATKTMQQAQHMMTEAEKEMKEASAPAKAVLNQTVVLVEMFKGLTAAVQEFVEEVQDGVEISLEIPEDHNFGDLLTGKTRRFPLQIHIDFEEEQDVIADQKND